MPWITLTERRKADREQMAAMVEELCARHGVACERSKYHGPREIRLEIECEGVGVGIDFDGDNPASMVDNYCLPWCVKVDSDRRLSDTFGAFQHAEVNPFHRRKCTTFARGINGLLGQLEDGFELLKSGRGFEERAS